MTKTIFITGATSGFGKATVEMFARNGWNVAATCRNPELADMYAGYANVRMYDLDVTNDDQVQQVAAQVIADFGHVDVISNNAGYGLLGSLEGSSMAQIRSQFDTNVFGLIAVTKAFLPHMRGRKAGMIFNISSASAIANYPFVSVYGASKWAVRGLSESLFIELAPFNIKIKTIYPGLHATKIFTKLDPATGEGSAAYAPYLANFLAIQGGVQNGGAPDKVAQTIWDAVQADDDRRDYLVNRDAKILAFLKRWLSDKRWKSMNLGSIMNAPSRLMLRVANLQINGTKPMEIVINPSLRNPDHVSVPRP